MVYNLKTAGQIVMPFYLITHLSRFCKSNKVDLFDLVSSMFDFES